MTLRAFLSAGLPPYGLGWYGRDGDELDTVPARFLVLSGVDGRLDRWVDQARARGLPIWLFAGPSHFEPGTWEATLDRLERRAADVGAVGVVADPEGGWPELSQAARREALARFGARLRDLATRTRVGVTSYPLFPDLELLAEAAGHAVWGSPQIYGRTSQDAREFARWWSRWEALFGSRAIPSIAGWAANPEQRTREGYREYLARLPKAGGAIVWTAAGPGETPGAPFMAEELRVYEPGGSTVGTLALAARSFFLRPVGIGALAVIVAIAAMSALFLSKAV